MNHEAQQRELEDRLIQPLTHNSKPWYAWMGVLLVLVVAGAAAYAVQLKNGLAVTGMGDTVTWGVYISNFVFFSGVGMAGTFISGILRLTGAEWRRPLTRFSELTTVGALTICAIMPAVDMGRPDRLWHLLLYGRLESPLVWDIMVIPTYLTASIIYLYLFLIPDAAFLRDRLGSKVSGRRQRLYTFVAAGWEGNPEQKKKLAIAGNLMMVLIIPIAVATHSVVSWIFATTYRAGWDSTLFPPYFVVGALYSGTAMLITTMYIFRKAYHLEAYLTPKHFKLLGTLMVVFGIVYIYFTFAEYMTPAYKMTESDSGLLGELFFGRYSLIVWLGFVGGQIIPVLLGSIPKTRTMGILFFASILANVGMWIKRFLIVVPSLSVPLLPYSWGVYKPTPVEILITIGSMAGFALIITVFAKLFPIISLEEMAEGWEAEAEREAAKAPVAPHLAPAPAPGGGK